MRPEFDSEIDSVLRGHARRGGASPVPWDAGARPSISGAAASGSHLDADEVAAFGEGALPPAARARYSSHLADCDDCRRSVAQVALAAGVADRFEERERSAAAAAAAVFVAEKSPSWRERLAAVFAPRAWRYAMPVVALVAVSAVVLVVTRRVPREGLTEMAARRDGAGQQNAAPAAAPEAHHADANQPRPSAQAEAQAGNTATAGVTPATGEDGYSGPAGELAKLSPKAAEGVEPTAVTSTVGAASAQSGVAPRTQAEPSPPVAANYAIVIPATPTPPPPPATAPAQRSAILRDIAAATPTPLPPAPTPAPAEVEARGRTREEARAAATRDEEPATKRHGPQRGGNRSMAELSTAERSKDDRVSAARRARGPAKAESNRNEGDEAKSRREENREQQREAETRSVGGRRFRREGNVWIDTAYRSSQATVVVRRDSEQYRALVADEPEIGRISRALGGEAVIVWKGRAYRVKP